MIGTSQGETEIPLPSRDEGPPVGGWLKLLAARDRLARLTVEQRSQSSIGGNGADSASSTKQVARNSPDVRPFP